MNDGGEPAGVYEALGNDLYSIGVHLDRWKYRYLRWSYVSLLIGFVATLVSLLTIFT